MSNSINREVASMFNSFSSGFVMDNGYSMVELENDDLVVEDSPHVRHIMEQALLAAAFEDVTEKANEYVYTPSDVDDVAFVVEAQVAMKRLGSRQHECQVGVDQIQSRLDAATEGDYLPRQQFLALVERKKDLISEKLRLRSLWKKGLDACKDVIGDDKGVWGRFFSIEDPEAWLDAHLSDDSMFRGFTHGDTSAVDDGLLLPEEDNDVADMLSIAHLVEMKEYDRPESAGQGYWDWKVEKKIERKYARVSSK